MESILAEVARILFLRRRPIPTFFLLATFLLPTLWWEDGQEDFVHIGLIISDQCFCLHHSQPLIYVLGVSGQYTKLML